MMRAITDVRSRLVALENTASDVGNGIRIGVTLLLTSARVVLPKGFPSQRAKTAARDLAKANESIVVRVTGLRA